MEPVTDLSVSGLGGGGGGVTIWRVREIGVGFGPTKSVVYRMTSLALDDGTSRLTTSEAMKS
jgi:hypothetical protein